MVWIVLGICAAARRPARQHSPTRKFRQWGIPAAEHCRGRDDGRWLGKTQHRERFCLLSACSQSCACTFMTGLNAK